MSDNKPRQRVFGPLILHALTRWESLVTIIVTAILFLFVRDVSLLGVEWQPWFWLVLGGIAEAALVASTITDPEASEQALSAEFEKQYDLKFIRNAVSRERLRDAFEYRRNMIKLVDRHRGGMRTSLRQTINDINDWITHMYNLAEHIDVFESNSLVERDRRMVPQEIGKTKQRIELERDDIVRAELERKLRQLEQQRINLEATASSVKRAEIQLESTLASLGTVYAQMSLLGTKQADGAKAQRLRLEIQDEVASLQDTIDAMDEVQMQSLRLR